MLTVDILTEQPKHAILVHVEIFVKTTYKLTVDIRYSPYIIDLQYWYIWYNIGENFSTFLCFTDCHPENQDGYHNEITDDRHHKYIGICLLVTFCLKNIYGSKMF